MCLTLLIHYFVSRRTNKWMPPNESSNIQTAFRYFGMWKVPSENRTHDLGTLSLVRFQLRYYDYYDTCHLVMGSLSLLKNSLSH